MSLRNFREQQLKNDYLLLLFILITLSLYAVIIISMNFAYNHSRKVEEQFAQFAVIALPPPPPMINEEFEEVPPPEIEDMTQPIIQPLEEDSADVAEGAVGEEGAMPEDLMMEQKIATDLNTAKPLEEIKTPEPLDIPKREKTPMPVKNLMASRSPKKAPRPDGTAKKGEGQKDAKGTGQKTFGRGEFGLGEGGGSLLGSKSGLGRGGAGANPFGSRFGSGAGSGRDIKEGLGRKSKKTIRVIVEAFVLADGHVDTVEYIGAIGIEDLEPPEMESLINMAVQQIRSKQYEPSNDPMRKIREEIDFSYMGKEAGSGGGGGDY